MSDGWEEDYFCELFEDLLLPPPHHCPRCAAPGCVQIMPRHSGPDTRHLWRCKGGCKKQFTVRIGTPMEDSRLSFADWYIVFGMVEDGDVTARMLMDKFGIARKSALYMMDRVAAWDKRSVIKPGRYKRSILQVAP